MDFGNYMDFLDSKFGTFFEKVMSSPCIVIGDVHLVVLEAAVWTVIADVVRVLKKSAMLK